MGHRSSPTNNVLTVFKPYSVFLLVFIFFSSFPTSPSATVVNFPISTSFSFSDKILKCSNSSIKSLYTTSKFAPASVRG